ncbi:hypothetical protein ACHAXR_012177 [Thalassiosira sp. AJA248-18]
MNQPIVASVPIPSSSNGVHGRTASQKSKRGPRGGIYDPFPLKFHRMLDQVKEEGQESIVSWLPHGRAFKIHQPKVFAATIMTRFFNQSKYTSFQRQLNLYGFSRCCRGRDAGAYHHPFFLRGKQTLSKNIVRTKIKGNGHKTMRLHDAEPDFHAMAPLLDDAQEESLSDGSSIGSASSLEQPTMAAPVLGLSNTASPPPSSSPEGFVITNSEPPSPILVDELSRRSSLNSSIVDELSLRSSLNSSDFLNDLNQSIFIHELAVGCTILCKLRKDTNL